MVFRIASGLFATVALWSVLLGQFALGMRYFVIAGLCAGLAVATKEPRGANDSRPFPSPHSDSEAYYAR